MTDLTQPTYEYEFHPLADMFPLMEGEDFNQLAEDIGNRGILSPIILHEGKILDGRNRYNAAKDAGHKFTDRDFKQLSPGLDPEAFVISANLKRRQLTSKQKREFIAKLIEAKPDLSNRALAKLIGADDKTVASVREELKNRGEAFAKSWNALNQTQRQEFVSSRRQEIGALLGLGISAPYNPPAASNAQGRKRKWRAACALLGGAPGS
jgi:ParB-like chromosome segregation protein Spo0J